MNSEYWVAALGVFIHDHLETLKAFLRFTKEMTNDRKYNYFMNEANM